MEVSELGIQLDNMDRDRDSKRNRDRDEDRYGSRNDNQEDYKHKDSGYSSRDRYDDRKYDNEEGLWDRVILLTMYW